MTLTWRAILALVGFGSVAAAAAALAVLDAFTGGPALPWALAVSASGFAVAPALAERSGSTALGAGARGAAVAGGAFVLLGGLVDPFPAFADDAALVTLAITAFATGDRLERARSRAGAYAASAVFLLAAWTRLEDGLLLLPAEPWRARAVLGAGAGTVAATALARAAVGRGHTGGGLWRTLTESPLRNLLVIVPLALVLAYRRVLADLLPHIQIYEWGLGLALAFYAVAALRARHRDAVTDAPWSSGAARHVVRVEPRPDAALDAARRAFGFVDSGAGRDGYVAWWEAHAPRAGVPADVVEAQLARLRDGTGQSRAWSRARGRDEDTRAIREAVHRALLAQVANAPRPAGADRPVQRPERTGPQRTE